MSSKAYFDQIAQDWDRIRSEFFSENVRVSALIAAGARAGQTALDAGAGSGFVTEALLRAGLRVIAVDQSESMLTELARRFSNGQVETRVGEAAALPLEDASVDHAFANMFLHHVEDPAAAIQDLARTLKPGGRLVITDLDEHTHEFLATEQHDRWLGFRREDVAAWFKAAGLQNVSVRDVGEKCCSGSSCSSDRAEISIFLAVGQKAGGDDLLQIHDSVRAHYGALAASSSGCCGDGCSTNNAQLLYDANLVGVLPADITGFSMGCGDPVTIASLKVGETVLDLGSGGGMDCFLAAKQVGASGRVIGVDMTPEMLAKAEANKAKLGAENVEFRQGQIEALPIDDNSIDVIMSNCVINLSPDKVAVFAEAYRVLKPGGRLAISDIVTEGRFSDAQRADMTAWSACVSGALEAAEYVRLLQEAGFEEVAIVDKFSADGGSPSGDGMPRIYSARITGRKPTLIA